MIQIAFVRPGLYMCEVEPMCAENIGLKDITRSRRGELISRGKLKRITVPKGASALRHLV